MRQEKIRLTIESVAALAAVTALIISIVSLNNTRKTAEKSNELTEQANRLIGAYRVSWYAHRTTPTNPWSLRFENRSLFPTYRTILLNEKEKENIIIWTLPPCTRITIPLTDATD